MTLPRVDLSSVDPARIPLALAEAHWSTQPGDCLGVVLPVSLGEPLAEDLIEGAGFEPRDGCLERRLSLPDSVGPGMGLLVCGLNPSVHAAEAGVGFAGPGNRFWPAAMECGLLRAERDPVAALVEAGVGMTDLVKRATRRASELEVDEYRRGLARVERLVGWLSPAVICFVGLAGWRVAVDRQATAGPQVRRLGGRPVYLMPSTSGLNTHVTRQELAAHLESAAALAT